MQRRMRKARFDPEKVQAVADEMARTLTESGLSSVEMAYATAAVLRGIGEATYDRSSVEFESVLKDYKTSPSWPAALILHADQVHRIYELFMQERRDPTVNERAWKAHEEQLNVRRKD